MPGDRRPRRELPEAALAEETRRMAQVVEDVASTAGFQRDGNAWIRHRGPRVDRLASSLDDGVWTLELHSQDRSKSPRLSLKATGSEERRRLPSDRGSRLWNEEADSLDHRTSMSIETRAKVLRRMLERELRAG